MTGIYSHMAFENEKRVNEGMYELLRYEGKVKPKYTCYKVFNGTAISYHHSIIQQVYSNCGMVILYISELSDYDFLIDLCKTMEYSLVVVTLADDQVDKKNFLKARGFQDGGNSETRNKRSDIIISTYFLKI